MVAGNAAEQGPEGLASAVRTGSITHQDVGTKLGALIQHAHDWAGRIRSEAETEAMRTKERARQAAQKMIDDAEHEAAAIRRRAEQDADERVAYAKARIAELQEAIAAVADHGATLRSHLLAAADALKDVDTDIELPEGIGVDASLLDLDEAGEGEAAPGENLQAEDGEEPA